MLLYFVLLLSDGKLYKENPLLTRLGLPHPGDEEFVTIGRDSPINVGKSTHFESSVAEPGTETPTRHGNLEQRQFQPGISFTLGLNGLQYSGSGSMPDPWCACVFPCKEQGNREPTSGLEPLSRSLRVCGQSLQGCAEGCRSCIFRGVSFLCLAECCIVLRSRWYQEVMDYHSSNTPE
jgi:hypothetical protein